MFNWDRGKQLYLKKKFIIRRPNNTLYCLSRYNIVDRYLYIHQNKEKKSLNSSTVE